VLPATDYTEAGKHQAAARHWSKHTLPGLLSDRLDQLHSGDDIVYIEKITIDISDFPWNMTDAAWRSTIADAIGTVQSSPDSLALIVQQWLFYLQHGCFEKTAILNNSKAIEQYLLSHRDKLPVAALQQPGRSLSLPLLQRLFYQHTKELAAIVIGQVFQLDNKNVPEVYTIILQQLKADPDATFALLSKIVAATMARRTKEKERLLDLLIRPDTNKKNTAATSSKNDRTISEKREDNQLPTANLPIDCPLAGLVLLFPYIKLFLENSGLVKDDAFVDEAAQHQAVQVLYYLATGQSLPTEESLILPKLLCGIELSVYISFEEELPLALQTEAHELLQAVIGHWQVLQHTSVDGFRETFLQRDGKLVWKGESYVLQVAESGVDILLNSIPWGFRNYRLPWMPYSFITEWY